MRRISAIVIWLCCVRVALFQETDLGSGKAQDADDRDCVDPSSDNDLVREQRSFFKKKFCKGGGLFGHYKGHQGSYDYGHYHDGYGGGYGGHHGSGYGGGYGGGYGSGYGGGYGGSYGGGYGTGYGGGYGGGGYNSGYKGGYNSGYGGGYNSGYGGGYNNGYGGGYNSGYGGGYNGGGYGGGYGGNHNSRPSYGGNGYNKAGLSYSIGGYGKSPGYGPSYPSYSSYQSSYSGDSYNKPSSYGYSHSSGGYSSRPRYLSAFDDDIHGQKKNESHSEDRTSTDTSEKDKDQPKEQPQEQPQEQPKEQTESHNGNYEQKERHNSNYASIFSFHSKKEHSKPSKDNSNESSSSEEDNENTSHNSYHKGHHRKDYKEPSIIPVPVLPVVSQPLYYVPHVPTVSVVPPVAYPESLYSSYDYSRSGYGFPSYQPPVTPLRPATQKYTSGVSVYQTVTPSHASSAALYNSLAPSEVYPTAPVQYPAAPVQYPSAPVQYPALVAPAVPATLPVPAAAPVGITYANAVPTYQNQAYLYPTSSSYPAPVPQYSCGGYGCGSQQYSPTYTVTSFDVQTITSPYQPVHAKDVTTYAKSGSSVATANAPPGYVVSSLATNPLGSTRSEGSGVDNSPYLGEKKADTQQEGESTE